VIGRQRASSRVDAEAVKGANRRILADLRTTAAGLLGPIDLCNRTGAGNRILGTDERALRWRERRRGIVFGRLVRIERERGRNVLSACRLLGNDIAAA
jgi:hypothetical protein